MKIKKLTASILASVVAVSTVATFTLSAAKVDQKSSYDTWNLSNKTSTEAFWKFSYSLDTSPMNVGIATDSGLVKLKFASNEMDMSKIAISDVAITATGAPYDGGNQISRVTYPNDGGDSDPTTFELKVSGNTSPYYDTANKDVLNAKAFSGEVKLSVSYTAKDRTLYSSKDAAKIGETSLSGYKNDGMQARICMTAQCDYTKTAAFELVKALSKVDPTKPATGVNVMINNNTAMTSDVGVGEASTYSMDYTAYGSVVSGIRIAPNVANNLDKITNEKIGSDITKQLFGTYDSTIAFEIKGDGANFINNAKNEDFKMGINGTSTLAKATKVRSTGTNDVEATFAWKDVVDAYGNPAVITSIELYSTKPVSIEFIKADVPAGTYEANGDLAAGEGVAVTTEAIATTAAVAETTAAPV
ncbi:MAG: hypothetical protein RR540_00620, partial [Oscillospiraceae bacterium]